MVVKYCGRFCWQNLHRSQQAQAHNTGLAFPDLPYAEDLLGWRNSRKVEEGG